jgi:hypothetical protein
VSLILAQVGARWGRGQKLMGPLLVEVSIWWGEGECGPYLVEGHPNSGVPNKYWFYAYFCTICHCLPAYYRSYFISH